MKVDIVVLDPQKREELKPFIVFAQQFKGNINKSYTHGIEWTSIDVQTKNELLAGLRKLDKEGRYVIGAGSGHVYINEATATRFERDYKTSVITDKTPVSINGIFDRLLLITDNITYEHR